MADAAFEGKRSWRSPSGGGMVGSSRYVWRWIFSLLAITLIATAIYWAWPRPDARTLLLVLADDREQRNILPPVPYVAEDTAALLAWAEAARVPSHSLLLSKVQSPAWLARQLTTTSTNNQLKFRVSANSSAIAPKKDDTLVIYIKGHGLALDVSDSASSISGEPSRAKLDIRPIIIKSLGEENLGTSWYLDNSVLDVGRVLEELAKLPDLHLLVIFDAVHLNYDPRLGTLVNAFPSAVKQAIDQLPSRARLSVLIGQSDGECAVNLPDTARSALVDSLVSSLERKPGDGKTISLESLVERTNAQLVSLNQQGNGSFLQRVQASLPPAGKGLATVLALPKSPPPPPSDKPAQPPTIGADLAKAAANSAPVQAATAPVQQAVTDAKTVTSAVTGGTHPPAPQAAPAKVAGAATDASTSATPPTASATSPSPPVAGQTAANPSAPASGAPSALPAAGGANAAPPTVSAPGPPPTDLQLAWESRDRLRSAFKTGWSPAQVGPQLWRRIEGLLAGFDEQRVSGEQDPKDAAALIALRDDLRQLEAIFAGREGSCSTESCSDLAKSLAAFKRSPAFQSFQARQQSGFESANDALKAFAETAYRARDYVLLHGQTLALQDGGPFASDATLLNLLEKLRPLRDKLDPTTLTDFRLTEIRARELANLLRDVDAAREQVESQIEDYALSVAKTPASPGKLLRVRLLLHSPVVTANVRTELRKHFPAKGGTAPGVPTPPRFGELLVANAKLLSKLAAISGTAHSSSGGTTKQSAAAITAWTNLLDSASPNPEPLAWLELGRANREFATALTKAVKDETASRVSAPPGVTSLESWNLFKTMLLVDGRDAARLNSGGSFVSWLAQPIRPELIPDKVEFAPPSPVQLNGKDQEAKLVSIDIRLQSEKQGPFPVTLDLRWNPSDVDVSSGDGTTILRQGKNELLLDGGKSPLQLRVRPQRVASENVATLIRAEASFGSAQPAKTELSCLLPRPDQIELTISPNDDLKQARIRTWSPSLPTGGRLNLFANRERMLKLYLTNLSSEDKKLTARLYRVPPGATSPGGRLFAGLSLTPAATTLDTHLKQPNTDIANELRPHLIAQTEKEPFPLPVGSGPVAIPLVAVPPTPPSPPVGGAPGNLPADRNDDATGGLLLVVTNAAGKSQPDFKWIELQMLQPDDLLAIKDPLYRDGRFTYRVELKDPQQLIDEMGIGKEPVKLQWETRSLPAEVQVPKKDEIIEATSKQGALFSATVPPATRWPLFLQISVDRDPRALVTSLEKRGDLVLPTNRKENHPPSVHIWRAGASPARLGMPPERMQLVYRPRFPWLAYPAASLVAEGVREGEPGKPIPIRIDPDAPTTRLDFSLGADVAPRYFTEGARLRISTDDRSQEFVTDRQVSFRASVLEGNLLQVRCEADDFSKIEFGPIDVPSDKRLTFTAEVEGNFRSAAPSEDSHDSVTFILDRTPPRVFDLTAVKLPPPQNPVIGVPTPTKIQIRCRADDGNGSGIDSLEFFPGIDANGNRKLDQIEQQPSLPAIKQPDGFYEAEYVFPGELPNRALFMVEAIATDNVKYKSAAGQASVELIKPQIGGNRPTFGKLPEDPMEKAAKKAPPPPKK